MQQLGVRYALAIDGSVADPETAPKLERVYRCFDCKERVHVRRGEVRRPYFAHYAERPHPCSAETIAHEAAKRKLAALLLDGARSLELLLACRGHTDAFKDARACPDGAQLERSLPVPDFDTAGVEVVFGSYRLDAAASSRGRVVLGLEVYQSHLVDPAKRAALSASGLPWAEVHAEAVLGQPQPWQVITSGFGPHQCERCVARDAAALAERRRREAAEAARREADKRADEQEAEREAYNARIVQVARKGNNLIFGRRDRVGMVFTCVVCKEPVTATRIGPDIRFLHRPGKACDARRAWVRAGMWEVFKQLERAPEAVRIHRRCSGEACAHVFREPPPEFDKVGCEEPSLTLFKAGVPLMQLVFGSEPKLLAAEVLELRPGKAAHRPTVWWRCRNGRLCDVCTSRLVQMETATRERREAISRELEALEQAQAEQLRERRQQRLEAEHTRAAASADLHLMLLRRKAERLNQDPERVRLAAEFARRYLAAYSVDLEHARTFGVVVRRCEHCRKPVAALFLHDVPEVPAGLEHIVEVYPNRVVGSLLHNHCGGCSGRLSNAHEQTEPNRVVYLLPEDLATISR